MTGLGGIDIKQDEGTYGMSVRSHWSSAENWVGLTIDLGRKRIAALDIDEDDARQLAALLLEAAGNEDLAKAIPADIARRTEAERIRQEASEKLRAAWNAAKAAFVEATREQQAAFNAAIDEAEGTYGEVAHERVHRSVDLSGNPDPWNDLPF